MLRWGMEKVREEDSRWMVSTMARARSSLQKFVTKYHGWVDNIYMA
jgi:hypothetical protein